jgi:hypothetical protein
VPSATVRRSALLLPLSLALCGDSLNLSGGCGGSAKDTTVTVPLTCTLEAGGALVEPMTCSALWFRDPRSGPGWTIELDGLATSHLAAWTAPPGAQFVLGLAGPGEVGAAYGPDLAAPRALATRGQVATAEPYGYRVDGGPGASLPAKGQLTLVITSVAPLTGTFDATLEPGEVRQVLRSPAWSAPAGPGGTTVTLHGTFREP